MIGQGRPDAKSGWRGSLSGAPYWSLILSIKFRQRAAVSSAPPVVVIPSNLLRSSTTGTGTTSYAPFQSSEGTRSVMTSSIVCQPTSGRFCSVSNLIRSNKPSVSGLSANDLIPKSEESYNHTSRACTVGPACPTKPHNHSRWMIMSAPVRCNGSAGHETEHHCEHDRAHGQNSSGQVIVLSREQPIAAPGV